MSGAAEVVSAAKAIDDKLKEIDAVSGRIDALSRRNSELTGEFETIVADRNSRNLAATLAETPLPADDPEESKRLRKIKAEIAAAESAIPVLSAERGKLEGALPALRRSHAEAFLRWKNVQVGAAINLASEVLSGLQSPIARLSALEMTQTAMLGANFDVGPDIDEAEMRNALLSTGALAKRLIEGLPKRLIPSALSPEELAPAAETARHAYAKELDQ